ncbi:MAG TPA: NADH-quinone oxidoreductase subunit NuoH [Candidatus Acidoferrales bacterium]|jgi:NADH-quinone oxidoreductase subunit H|nr:NADH-quinone oxidoreductase subunit NuoH [Candidatus Acidoferrales bacterium]
MLSTLYEFFKPHLFPLLFAVVIVAVLPLLVGYVVLLERKVMAHMQARLGPERVGPHGLLQPIADALKLLIKEDIIPENSDKWIFWLAPLLSVTAGMLAMAAIPFGPFFQIANMNVGLLFILGVSSMGIFGLVLGGWASNSNYSLLGALRSSAQLVSYETAAGMAVVSGVMLGGTLTTRGIVEAQASGHVWFIFVAPIGFFLYMVASIAETNRAPFDMPEADSELVAGYMTEYSGFRWALYFLAEYTNMIVVASIATTLFLGGWLRPFSSVHKLDFLDYVPMLLMLLVAGYSLYRAPKQPVAVQKMFMVAVAGLCLLLAVLLGLPQFAPAGSMFVAMKPGVHGAFWFLLKVGLYIYLFLWLRFTFPRYRFDQLMKLGWHFLIPVSIVNVFALGVALYLHRSPEDGGYGWGMWASVLFTSLITLLIAAWLLKKNAPGPVNPALDEF